MNEQAAAAERELSIATMEPTLRQRWLALAIIVMLSIGFAAIAPFAAKQLVRIVGFIPTVEAIIFVTSLTTAVLLFSQSRSSAYANSCYWPAAIFLLR